MVMEWEVAVSKSRFPVRVMATWLLSTISARKRDVSPDVSAALSCAFTPMSSSDTLSMASTVDGLTLSGHETVRSAF